MLRELHFQLSLFHHLEISPFSPRSNHFFSSLSLSPSSIQSIRHPLSSHRTFYDCNIPSIQLAIYSIRDQTTDINFLYTNCQYRIRPVHFSIFHLNWNVVTNKWFPNCTLRSLESGLFHKAAIFIALHFAHND